MLSRIPMAFLKLALAAATTMSRPSISVADELDNASVAARLVAAYPDDIAGVDGSTLKFKDGTELVLDDQTEKPFEAWLVHPSIKDMFRYSYPQGADAVQPLRNFDPGRARNEAFFTKIYGDCRGRNFKASLTTVRWLAKKAPQQIMVSRKNGVALHLQAVSDELDALPAKYDVYVTPSAGGYVCRDIAGSTQRSGHGYGIAIDIATQKSHYWRWAKGGASGTPVYRNEIPLEIVRIFEKHGFIWGGRWYHYDTMHFEYRPELLGASN